MLSRHHADVDVAVRVRVEQSIVFHAMATGIAITATVIGQLALIVLGLCAYALGTAMAIIGGPLSRAGLEALRTTAIWRDSDVEEGG